MSIPQLDSAPVISRGVPARPSLPSLSLSIRPMTRRVLRGRAVNLKKLAAVIGSGNLELVVQALRSPLVPVVAQELSNLGPLGLEHALRGIVSAPVEGVLSPPESLAMTLFADTLGRPTGEDVVLTRGFADPGALIRDEAYGQLLTPYWQAQPRWAARPTPALRIVQIEQGNLVKARQGTAFWVPRFISDATVTTLVGAWGWSGVPSRDEVVADGDALRDALFKSMGDAKKQRKDLVLWFSGATE